MELFHFEYTNFKSNFEKRANQLGIQTSSIKSVYKFQMAPLWKLEGLNEALMEDLKGLDQAITTAEQLFTLDTDQVYHILGQKYDLKTVQDMYTSVLAQCAVVPSSLTQLMALESTYLRPIPCSSSRSVDLTFFVLF